MAKKHKKYVEEWLKLMPKSLLKKFMKNLTMFDNMSRLEEEEDSWSGTISGSFVWNKTPEGHDFWSDVARNEPEKALPKKVLPKNEKVHNTYPIY